MNSTGSEHTSIDIALDTFVLHDIDITNEVLIECVGRYEENGVWIDISTINCI